MSDTEILERYKIQARKDKNDVWQEFTGVKMSTIERMTNHCKVHLISLPYQFGIFKLDEVFVPELNKSFIKWVLVKIV